MQKVTAFIALGSNLENPVTQIERAIQYIREIPNTDIIAISPFYQNPPMGPQNQNDFVNAVVSIATHLDQKSLLHALQHIEHQMKRVRSIHWGPRIIDLDLLLYDELQYQDDELTLPHQGIRDRIFVLKPLHDIAPTLQLPDGKQIATLLKQAYAKGAPTMTAIHSFQQLRREYDGAPLIIETMNPDPILQCQQWIEEAITAQVQDPTAMVLSTVNQNAEPSSRVVLLKGIEDRAFIFYTHYQSRKGLDLTHNPAVAANFFYPLMSRQIIIQGDATPLASEISDAYFASRPRESQIAAHASNQSHVIHSREELINHYQALIKQFGNSPIPRPDTWGGYAINPYYIEFWQGHENRLHDRIAYTLSAEQWEINCLAP